MNMRRYLLAFTLLLATVAHAADIFPAERRAPWVADVDVGVQGGFRRFQAGGANARPVTINVVTDHSADRTGATDATPAINAAITAVGTNGRVHVPAGRYRAESTITGNLKDNFTLSGDPWSLSRSTITVGTGTKTFIVPAGGPWVPGIATRIWKWDRQDATITSITRSGSTATVTTEVEHKRATGEMVFIDGPTQTEYNGRFIITVTGSTTFTIQVTGSPATPATNTYQMRFRDASFAPISSITRSGSTVTVTTRDKHYRGQGFAVTLGGADQAEYNGTFNATVTGDYTFTFTTADTPASPATTSTELLWFDNQVQGPNVYMDVEVISYVDDELEVAVDTIRGSGTWSKWKVGGTVIDFVGTGNAIRIGQDPQWDWLTNEYNTYVYAPHITGSLVKGATSLTVDIGTFGEPVMGDLMQLSIQNNYAANEGYAGTSSIIFSLTGFEYNLRQMVRVTGITNNGGNSRTLTFFPELVFDMPSARVPRATWFSNYAENVGVENITIFGDKSTTNNALFKLDQTINCWAYNVDAHLSKQYNAGVSSSLFTTFHGCWFTHTITGADESNKAGVLASHSSGGLYENSVFGVTSFPTVEMNSFVYNAFVGCYMPNKSFNPNHAPHPMMNVFEGCIFPFSVDDGYFGGSGGNTYLRNWISGVNIQGGIVQGSINNRRGAYNSNIGGNILGTPNFANGDFGFGQPNIGNGSFYGTASPTTGDYWVHLTGGTPVLATLTTRTDDDTATFTLTTLAASVFQDPIIWNGETQPFTVRWGSAREGRSTLVVSGWSGNTLVFSGGSGTNFPAEGTAVEIWANVPGFQEWDNDVGLTTIEKGNYLITGSSGTQSTTSGGTIEVSYVYPTAPWWWRSSLTYPAINPSTPNFADGHAILPISYLYINGEQAADSGGGSPPVAASGLNATTASSTQINVTWNDNSDNETGFRLERRIGVGSWSTVTTTAANATSYSNTGLTPSTTYEYRVFAVNGAGDATASNTDSATTDAGSGESEPAFTPSTTRPYKLLFRR